MNKKPFVLRNVDQIATREWNRLIIRDINSTDITSNLFSLTRIELPPRTKLPSIRHLKTIEFIYVLDGSATALLNSEKVSLKVGDYLFMEAGVWHSFVSGEKGVKALSFYSPAINVGDPDVEMREMMVSRS